MSLRRPVLASFVLSVAALVPVWAGGEPHVSSSSELAAELASERSSLAGALDAIRTRGIQADIEFIASDDMQGRDTPSEGLEIAARYIRSRLTRLGFEPGAPESSFFHEYRLRTTAMDADATRVEIVGGREPVAFRIGSGFHIGERYLRESTEHRGRVVFVGDRAALETAPIEGAWAVLLDDGGSTGPISRSAAAIGALGIILTPGPGYAEEPYDARFAERIVSLLKGSVSLPAPEGHESPSRPRRRANISYLSRDAFAQLREVSPARPDGTPASDWTPAAGTDLGLELVEHRVLAGGGEITVENVCGFWPGSDSELANEVILVSAHYDHVGVTDGKIYNGADDNGSGTTGLLALADALAVHGPLRRSVLLIWVSGEEKGLLGSRAWSDAPWLPGDGRPVANLNLDMIGRNDPNELFITPTEAHEQYNGIVRLAMALAPLEGFAELESADEYYYRSDQASFARLGIPVAFLFAGVHADYHQPSDEVDKIDADKIRRVTRLVMRMLDAMQTDSLEF